MLCSARLGDDIKIVLQAHEGAGLTILLSFCPTLSFIEQRIDGRIAAELAPARKRILLFDRFRCLARAFEKQLHSLRQRAILHGDDGQ